MRKKSFRKGIGVVGKAAAALGLAAAACGGEIAYFYGRTMKRGRAKTERVHAAD